MQSAQMLSVSFTFVEMFLKVLEKLKNSHQTAEVDKSDTTL